MKALLFFLSLTVSQYSMSQPTSNSQSRLPVDQAEQQAFDEWNKQEREAQQREETLRTLNEETSQGYGPNTIEKQEAEPSLDCKCEPSPD